MVRGLDVAEAGEYDLVIDYLVSGTRDLALSVNGGATQTLTLSGPSFGTPVSTTVRVHLEAGENTVRFSNDTAFAPDVDRVAVAE